MTRTNQSFLTRNNCPVCNGCTFSQLLSLPYQDPILTSYLEAFYNSQGFIDFSYLNDVDYVILKCLDCNFIFQQNIPSDELMEILYDKWIDPIKVFNSIDGVQDVEHFLEYAKHIANVIRHFNKKPQELLFLDFGMGWGHWCRVAQSYDCKVYGNELSSTRIEYAKKIGVEVISWESISIMKFDLINTDNVFEHISTPMEVLSYLKKSLKPDGLIRLYVPNSKNVENQIENLKLGKTKLRNINAIAPLEHINSFNYESLIEMGKKAGLQEIRIDPAYVNTFGDLIDVKIRQPIYRLFGNKSTDVYFGHNLYEQ